MSEVETILATVQGYFDALYEGDVEKFRRVFHAGAQLFTAEDGATEALDLDSYMTRVRNRASPASRGDARLDEVIGVTLASPTTAHVRVRTALGSKRFQDELLLVRYADGWRIACKAWAYDPLRGA